MPDLDLEPGEYRDTSRPQVIPRKEAAFLLVYCLGIALFMQWILDHEHWWHGFLMWAPLIMAGALITRLAPLSLLGKD